MKTSQRAIAAALSMLLVFGLLVQGGGQSVHAKAYENVYHVLVINYDPVIPSQGLRLHEVYHWNDPAVLAQEYADVMWEISYGYADYEVVDWIELDEMPVALDGFCYDPEEYYQIMQAAVAETNGAYYDSPRWTHKDYSFDYDACMRRFDVYDRVEQGEIDEVWIFAGTMASMMLYETQMIGRDAYWCNSPGLNADCRPFIVYGFNYERGVAEMVHDSGHRAEFILDQVYGWANYDKPYEQYSDWERFSAYESVSPGHAGVGIVHFPPNGTFDYDWGNNTYVLSACDDWVAYPDMTGRQRSVNCEEWGNGDSLSYLKWWFKRMPHVSGKDPISGKYRNWWVYYTLDYLNDPPAVEESTLSLGIRGKAASEIVGEQLSWFAAASGGSGSLSFRFDVYLDGKLIEQGTYNTDNAFSYVPITAGTYSVKAFVKDGTGTVVSKMSSDVIVTSAVPLQEGLAGENVRWTLYNNGDLIFSGSGPMQTDNTPWKNAGSIKRVLIEDGITSIGWSAFSSTDLEEIIISDTVTAIEAGAFANSKLKNITIPSSVSFIGEGALMDFDLTEITVEPGNSSYCSVNGILFSKDMTYLLKYPDAKSDENYAVPESVTDLAAFAFCYNTSLNSIQLSQGISVIHDSTFFFCPSLQEIGIPSAVERIEDSAFEHCTNLHSIYYGGTESEWHSITKGKQNTPLASAAIYYSSPKIATKFNAHEWAKAELAEAETMGIIPAELLDADLTQPITRAEFAAVSVKVYEALSGLTAKPAADNPFTDTVDPEVLKALNVGITNGLSATEFAPDRLLNREQAATMLTRVYKKVLFSGWTLEGDEDFVQQFGSLFEMPDPFTDDADISSWARDSVYFMAANGIIKGIEGGKFAPRAVIDEQKASGYAQATREQALLIAVRMVKNLK
jgi:hypothetical protein